MILTSKHTDFCTLYRSLYRYGYQGSESDSEVKGEGNSYTTMFRQLDPRIGRWLTIDPKASSMPWQSPYCSMDNNPIWFNDVLGDSIKTNEKAWENINEGLKRTLNESNPFKFNSEKGIVEYDKNVDISGLGDKELEIVNNYKSLIDDKEFNVQVDAISNDTEFADQKGNITTLRIQRASGVTILNKEGNTAQVYLSEEPLMSDGSVEIQIDDIKGITSLHEIGGHAYQHQQKIGGYANNWQTEKFERNARDVYKGKYQKNYIKNQDVIHH